MSNKSLSRPFSETELEQVARRFRVLGEPMRLRILQSVCHGPLPVGEIVEAVGATQANVSKHLAMLADAGILCRRKEGQKVYYGMESQLALKLCELVRSQLLDPAGNA